MLVRNQRLTSTKRMSQWLDLVLESREVWLGLTRKMMSLSVINYKVTKGRPRSNKKDNLMMTTLVAHSELARAVLLIRVSHRCLVRKSNSEVMVKWVLASMLILMQIPL